MSRMIIPRSIASAAAMFAALGTPAAAGAQTSSSFRASITSGDTIITIIRQDDEKQECSVRVGRRVLSGRDADAVCRRTSERFVISGDGITGLTAGRGMPEEMLARYRDLARTNAEIASLDGEQARRLNEQARELSVQLRDLTAQQRNLSQRNAELLFSTPSIANVIGTQNRAMIGVTPESRSRSTDRVGAYVAAVTPGGPAEKAGIRVGDVITRLNGVEIGVRNGAGDGWDTPSSRLIEAAGKLEAGKEVTVEFQRDGANRQVRIVPARNSFSANWTMFDTAYVRRFDSVPPRAWAGTVEAPAVHGRVTTTSPTLALSISRSVLRNVELAPMNEGLRGYFGTGTGVLVVNAPGDRDDNLGLLPGDVILEVGSRPVSTPVQLFRILGSYEKGEEISLQIMRQKSPHKLSARIP